MLCRFDEKTKSVLFRENSSIFGGAYLPEMISRRMTVDVSRNELTALVVKHFDDES